VRPILGRSNGRRVFRLGWWRRKRVLVALVLWIALIVSIRGYEINIGRGKKKLADEW